MLKRSVFILALLVFGAMTVFAQTPEPTKQPPTGMPTIQISLAPSLEPSQAPTEPPIVTPGQTTEPTVDITLEPTLEPTVGQPTTEPTVEVTTEPTSEVTMEPTSETQPTDSGPAATSEATMEATNEPGSGIKGGTGIGNMPLDMMMGMMVKEAKANATLMDADGNTVGQVWFFEFDDEQVDDQVFVVAHVMDLPEGFHGFHVHAVGSCEDSGDGPFTAAGGHLNLDGSMHDNHAGDLPELLIGSDGTGYLVVGTDRFALDDLFDDDGSALIIHGAPDNHANIPERYGGPDEETLKAGDSGPRLACGVVEEGMGTMMDMNNMGGKSPEVTPEMTPAS